MSSPDAASESTKFISFNEELNRALKKISEKHGIKIPKYNASIIDGAMFLNLSVFNGNPSDYYKKWFIDNADILGLNKNLVGKSFLNHNKSKTLTIIGLDPDGGDKCIRVEDEDKQHYHLSPAAILKLLAR